MSTNHTPNYALRLWEASDQVQRTEFNENHAKIDAALERKIERSQFIKTAITGNHTRGMVIDFSDIDWSEWEYVFLSFDVKPEISRDTTDRLECQLNAGGMSGYSGFNGSTFATCGYCPFLLVLLPWHDPSRKVQGVILGNEVRYGLGTGTFQELTSLGITKTTGSSNIYPGLIATVWGTK